MMTLGLEPASMTPDEMAVFMRSEQARYGTIIRNANIKIEQ
jgi:tripartite-type tricarboxylate transporter receptor subunit TctC